MSANLEFIVGGIVGNQAEAAEIIGRCGDTSLNLGDVFESLEDPAGTVKAVRIEIVSIQAYGHSLAELGFGMTGTLSVRGAGIEQIKPDCILLTGAVNQDNSSTTSKVTRTG